MSFERVGSQTTFAFTKVRPITHYKARAPESKIVIRMIQPRQLVSSRNNKSQLSLNNGPSFGKAPMRSITAINYDKIKRTQS